MTSEELCKSKVRAVLALMHPANKWAAMDEDGTWYAFGNKPDCHPADTYWFNGVDCEEIVELFDIPFPGDWRESLVER
jgi:hypothetical protein